MSPLILKRLGLLAVVSVAVGVVLLPYPWSLIAWFALMAALLAAATYIARRRR